MRSFARVLVSVIGAMQGLTSTLQLAFETYDDARYRDALLKFGDFLILAQLPEPQPAWAQQYNHQLQPIWARRFEPPAVAGRESEDAIQTLLYLTEVTGEARFLAPIPAAVAWLKRSQLPGGSIARFYEMETNMPLYFVKDTYELTYSDSNLPTHYSFKSESKVNKLESRYKQLSSGQPPAGKQRSLKLLRKEAEEIVAHLDPNGRWVTDKNGRAVVECRGLYADDLLLKSEVFSRNLTQLAEYISACKAAMP